MPSLGVYIPTIGRTTLVQQLTMRELTSKSSVTPVLVCGKGERDTLQEFYDGPIVECLKTNIGDTRQAIMESATEDVVVFADDDLRFDRRISPRTSTQLEVADNLDLLFDSVLKAVDCGYIHGGIGPRQGNTFVHKDSLRTHLVGNTLIKVCFRAFNMVWFVREKVAELGARWDTLPIMEDFAFSLYLIERGYPNAIINDFVWDQRGSNRVGGCSTYRTPELQKTCAIKLKNLYPRYIALTQKKSKSRWEGIERRWDVKIYWDKLVKKYIPVDRLLY